MRGIVKACRRPPAVRPRDRNGGFPRLSDGPMLLDGAQGFRCLASPRPALLAENLGKPSLWVNINDLWYYLARGIPKPSAQTQTDDSPNQTPGV